MSIQLRHHLPPADAQIVNTSLAIYHADDRVVYFAYGGPMFAHHPEDKAGARIALAQATLLGLAKPKELAEAVGVHRSTVHRNVQKLEKGGVVAVIGEGPGPRGPHKLTVDRLQEAQRWLDEGLSIAEVGRRVGVSDAAIHHVLNRGLLQRVGRAKGPEMQAAEERGRATPAGVAVHRHLDRALAAVGWLQEAPPEFTAAAGVRMGGALLALPSLLELGLLKEGVEVYGALRKGFYGLRSILLALTFMALVRIKSPEQLQHAPPGELGAILGLDRSPEPKTLRRKIREFVQRGLSYAFSQKLAQRWVEQDEEVLGFLYVDGHVRPYHGQKHELPKTWVPRRRLCMPAETDFWVNDQRGDPIFSITAEANDDLTHMLKSEILPEVRSLIGERPATIVFDREGWSPKLFWDLAQQGFDILTYRKGAKEPWPEECFQKVQGVIDGQTVEYALGQRSVLLLKRPRLWMREVRRLRDDGGQTAILTTRQDLDALPLAYRMFSRWRQENFFRYMRHEFALDGLLTYQVEAADSERMVPNPEITKLRKEHQTCRERLGRRMIKEEEYRHRLETEPKGRKASYARKKLKELATEIPELRARCKALKTQMAELPERVPVRQTISDGQAVQLLREAKHFSNTLKMLAYRAETVLVQLVGPHYARTEDEGRALVRQMLSASANLLPDEAAGVLRVQIHPLATPRANQALAQLCQQLNEGETVYPGTRLRMLYQPAPVA